MPEWKTAESYQKLLAAMVAAQEMKLDYRNIATYYGDGATYDSIEGRFRIIKKHAKVLQDEIDSGARPVAPPRGGTTTANTSFINNDATTPKKPRGSNKKGGAGSPTPTKKDKVLTGRVGKNTAGPKNLKGVSVGVGGENVVNGIKQETLSSGSSIYGGEEDGVGDVFEGLDLGYDGLQEAI